MGQRFWRGRDFIMFLRGGAAVCQHHCPPTKRCNCAILGWKIDTLPNETGDAAASGKLEKLTAQASFAPASLALH